MKIEEYRQFTGGLGKNVTLVAVSKMQPVAAISRLYTYGHRDFGENYVQELIEKQLLLPHDIKWHYIGHLQSNKARKAVKIFDVIHTLDSIDLAERLARRATAVP